MLVIKSYIKAPRWAYAGDFLKDLAFELNLDIELDVSKRILMETVQFKVSGERESMIEFKRLFELSVKNHGAGT